MSTFRYIERRLTPRNRPAMNASATTQILMPRIHRERDYGVGYGSSSGYASNRRYADTSGQVLFRCR